MRPEPDKPGAGRTSAGPTAKPGADAPRGGPPRLILASTSPRRRQLLAQLGVAFDLASPEVEELTADSGLEPAALAMENARRKAAAVDTGGIVIGADTVVTIDGDCLGKPADLAEAAAMLRRLSGRTHLVITGVALRDTLQGCETSFHETTAVTFHRLDEATIGRYLQLIEPLDKAGGYAAQDHGAMIIRRLDGPLDNVVGLPLAPLAGRLSELGAAPATAMPAAHAPATPTFPA